jgi:hypothetical protein
MSESSFLGHITASQQGPQFLHCIPQTGCPADPPQLSAIYFRGVKATHLRDKIISRIINTAGMNIAGSDELKL